MSSRLMMHKQLSSLAAVEIGNVDYDALKDDQNGIDNYGHAGKVINVQKIPRLISWLSTI